MLFEEFQNMLIAVSAAFGRKTVTDKTVLEWLFNAVSHIPSSDVPAITNRLKDRDSFPTNLEREVLRAWYDTCGKTNDGKKGCVNCNLSDESGMITAFKVMPSGEVKHFEFHCDQCHPKSPYATNKLKLKDAGYIVCPTSDKRSNDLYWRRYMQATTEHRKRLDEAAGIVRPVDPYAVSVVEDIRRKMGFSATVSGMPF